jgi:hypothetical protein
MQDICRGNIIYYRHSKFTLIECSLNHSKSIGNIVDNASDQKRTSETRSQYKHAKHKIWDCNLLCSFGFSPRNGHCCKNLLLRVSSEGCLLTSSARPYLLCLYLDGLTTGLICPSIPSNRIILRPLIQVPTMAPIFPWFLDTYGFISS